MSQPQTPLRRAFITFVVSVVVLDTVAIAIYQWGAVRLRPEKTQHIYLGIWMMLTVVVVVRNLTVMRKLRGGRRSR